MVENVFAGRTGERAEQRQRRHLQLAGTTFSKSICHRPIFIPRDSHLLTASISYSVIQYG
jgi:hypothetical protein